MTICGAYQVKVRPKNPGAAYSGQVTEMGKTPQIILVRERGSASRIRSIDPRTAIIQTPLNGKCDVDKILKDENGHLEPNPGALEIRPRLAQSNLHHQVSNSSHHLPLSINMPFASNSTPSPFNSSIFFSILTPLGAFCQSP